MADVLKLSTERVKRSVEIDATKYELLADDDLSLEHFAALEAVSMDCGEVATGKAKSKEELASISGRLRACSAIILPGIPAEVSAKLSDVQHLRLLNAFLGASVQRATEAKAQPAGVGHS
jgi:hypothetical protein